MLHFSTANYYIDLCDDHAWNLISNINYSHAVSQLSRAHPSRRQRNFLNYTLRSLPHSLINNFIASGSSSGIKLLYVMHMRVYLIYNTILIEHRLIEYIEGQITGNKCCENQCQRNQMHLQDGKLHASLYVLRFICGETLGAVCAVAAWNGTFFAFWPLSEGRENWRPKHASILACVSLLSLYYIRHRLLQVEFLVNSLIHIL